MTELQRLEQRQAQDGWTMLRVSVNEDNPPTSVEGFCREVNAMLDAVEAGDCEPLVFDDMPELKDMNFISPGSGK